MAFGVATDEDQSTFHPRIFPLVTILLILITFSFDMFYWCFKEKVDVDHSRDLTLSLANVVKGKFRPDFQISFSKIFKNKKYHVKVQAESFHLNGHIVGLRPQTQKFQSPFKSPSSTLAAKGLQS